jgi:hypothetical protein
VGFFVITIQDYLDNRMKAEWLPLVYYFSFGLALRRNALSLIDQLL